jgi:hypothetical protein
LVAVWSGVFGKSPVLVFRVRPGIVISCRDHSRRSRRQTETPQRVKVCFAPTHQAEGTTAFQEGRATIAPSRTHRPELSLSNPQR